MIPAWVAVCPKSCAKKYTVELADVPSLKPTIGWAALLFHISIPSGTCFAKCLAISLKITGLDSNKYLSKYSFEIWPDLNLKVPFKCYIS